MKIDYDVNLYKKIAKFDANEIVVVSNRKGVKTTIQIQNITKLSWHELQVLGINGKDKFTKMVLLYQKYSSTMNDSEVIFKGEKLNSSESKEINDYIKIYRNNNFKKHHEVNEFISGNNMWGKFPIMRSLNDHGKYKDIEGIQPKYYDIICQILKISGEKGLPLDAYKHY